MSGPPVFELRDVVAGPADAPILRNITVDIPADGITVLAGPSGGGKSTLLRLLNRLDDPLSGEISWKGKRLDEWAPTELRRQVAMIFQQPPLFEGTVRDNLRVALPDVSEERALHVLEHVDLAAELIDRDAALLSGGEAQRMCVARALLTEPDVVLADEPTAALDTNARHTVEDLAQRMAESGVALVWVTHDTDQLRRLADHVGTVIDGRLAAFGHLADLSASDDPVVRRLVGAGP
ncbi:MAG: ATP-binding cassette domain-containing protein [Actinomycetota bacterium]